MPYESNIGRLSDSLTIVAPLQPGDIIRTIGEGSTVRVWTGAKSSDLDDPDNWQQHRPPVSDVQPVTSPEQPQKEHPIIGKLRRSGMLAE